MTENFHHSGREVVALEARGAEVVRELERLRIEIEGLRASRIRLVSAADADRRTIERELHDRVHQHLIGLAVTLQLAGRTADSDLAAAKKLLEEMNRDLQQALDATALLAQRIYPATLDAGYLAPLLRSVAVNANIPASVTVAARSNIPAEVTMTIYLCWLDTVSRANGETRVAIRVRERKDALTFELSGTVGRSDEDFDRARDRVEALGGQLTVGAGSEGGIRVSGTLPLPPSR